MTIDIGTRVRLLLETVDPDGNIWPAQWPGVVVGYQGDRYLIELDDPETELRGQCVLDKWEFRAERTPGVRA